MARLFITERELNFFSDITREVIKDIVGQKIYYYPVSELKTLTHEVYQEAQQKIFDNPIIIDALVDNVQQQETEITKFGIDTVFKLEVFVQYRDLVEKGIKPVMGDFITYGDVRYEIADMTVIRGIYGQVERKDGVKLVCVKAREGQFVAPIKGPTDIKYTDGDAVQKTFNQQRGQAENAEGITGDIRANQENGNLEAPIEGIREVSERGDDAHTGTSTFYDE